MPKENQIKKKPRWTKAASKSSLWKYKPIQLRSGKKLLHLSLVKQIKAANKLPDNLFDDSSSEEEE
jgi:hypothetical protein